jgi:hypothetical protein
MNHMPSSYNNPLTRMIEGLSAHNAENRGSGAVVTGAPLPSSRSAAVGTIVEQPAPMSESERAEADAKLIELGIMPADGGEPNTYSSVEDAVRAGAPVEIPVTMNFRKTEVDMARNERQIFVAGQKSGPVRLPDFTKVGGIDLIRDVVYLDGMEFAIPKDHADEFRVYVIQRVREVITEQLKTALESLLPPATEATSVGVEDVQSVQGGEATK